MIDGKPCEAILRRTEEDRGGWPVTVDVRCAQVVGTILFVSPTGSQHYYCRRTGHISKVIAEALRNDPAFRAEMIERARHDWEEDRRAEDRREIGADPRWPDSLGIAEPGPLPLTNDAEELRSWGGKYSGWGR